MMITATQNNKLKANKQKLTELQSVMLLCLKKYTEIADYPSITLLEIHKICYFLQEAGVPLRLNFKPYIYGPYAVNLSHVLEKLEGSYISGFRDGTVKAFDPLFLINENLLNVESFISDKYKIIIDNVIDFLSGYANPVGVELLATIHWLIAHENISLNFDNIKKNIQHWGEKENQNWGKRKIKYFSDRNIQLAMNHLSELQK